MGTSDQTFQARAQGTRKRHRTVEERRKIVEETLLQGASVSRVARRHDVNANQVFHFLVCVTILALGAFQLYAHQRWPDFRLKLLASSESWLLVRAQAEHGNYALSGYIHFAVRHCRDGEFHRGTGRAGSAARAAEEQV
jgi:hypothetical protein